MEGSTEPYESIREDMVVASMATRLGNWKTQQSLHQQKMNEKVTKAITSHKKFKLQIAGNNKH